MKFVRTFKRFSVIRGEERSTSCIMASLANSNRVPCDISSQMCCKCGASSSTNGAGVPGEVALGSSSRGRFAGD